MNGAIFLDRDDTLIQDPGYLHDPDAVSLFPDTPAALALLRHVCADAMFYVQYVPGPSCFGWLGRSKTGSENPTVHDRVVISAYFCTWNG